MCANVTIMMIKIVLLSCRIRDLFRTVGLILRNEECLHTFYITLPIVSLAGTLLKQFSTSNKARVPLFQLKLFSKCGWFCGFKFLPV